MTQEKMRKIIECWVLLFIPYLKICLYWLSSLSDKKNCKIPVGSGEGSKHREKRFDRILGIVIADLRMKLMSFHWFLKNIYSGVMLKCLKRIFEYLFFLRIYYFGMQL